jgi:EAL domain-containing protein (putative c-di-GMP-specific phosphodiesterase class I)
LAGDAVLHAIGARLAAAARPADIVARLAGDTFVIAQPVGADPEAPAAAARAAQRLISEPLGLDGLPGIAITASLGVALFPEHGASVTRLLRNAESALHGAKAAGRNGLAFYRPEMTQAARRRVALEGALRRALAAGEFRLHYQPIVALQTGAIDHVEALIRWQHPHDGLLLPGTFIEAVEHSDLVHPVGRWVLEQAAAQAHAWLPSCRLRVSVNISGPQIAAGTLADALRTVLHATGLDAELLEIEVLERVLLRDPDQALDELNRVRDLGVAIALDDFGTGYSSLSYLKRLPVDVLKIDQSFIRHLVSDPGDAAIVRSTIGMAHNLGIKVVAEGVETEGQLNCLAELGCDLVQGFLLSRPVGPAALGECLGGEQVFAVPALGREAGTGKVMILASDRGLRTWLEQELAAPGLDLYPVGDQEAAWECLAREDIQVILVDDRPPHIAAVPFLERARLLRPQVVALLIATDPDRALLLAAINQCGAFKVLRRPVSARQVREAVGAAQVRARVLRQAGRAAAR